MKTAAITLLAVGAEPSELDARAHALKNCVSVIVGLASSIEPHVDPVARARAAQLVVASQRLRELLTCPAKTRDEDDARREIVRIEGVLRLVGERLAPQADSASVRLEIDCDGGTIGGDFAELTEALYNLASNALHASPPGSIVRIITRKNSEGDHEWAVEDHGCGIPANLMPQLGNAGITMRVGGMGLGLSLALKVVTRHHGVMRIESAEGRGTTVKVWLPGRRSG